jgi:hypothetical protein
MTLLPVIWSEIDRRQHAQRRVRIEEQHHTRNRDHPNVGLNRIRIADAATPEQIEIVDWADTRHLADLPPQPAYDQRRHLK